MEMSGTKNRIMGSCVMACLYALGEMWLGVAAMLVRDWRWLMRVIYGPGILVILLRYVLPESVRYRSNCFQIISETVPISEMKKECLKIPR